VEFKYIKNIHAEETDILLYNQIGSSVDNHGHFEPGIDGEVFAHEMRFLQERTKKINVRINSIGGSVFHAYSIMSAILGSKVPVDTYIDGLAASVAGVIAMTGRRIFMRDFGTLMLHNPSGGKDSEVLELAKKTLIKIFTERRGFKEEDVDKMMNDETWLDAETAKKKGFIDEIIASKDNEKIERTRDLANMVLIYNKIINPKNNKMKDLLNKFGLSENASESEAIAKFDAIQNAAKAATTELESTKKELKELQDKVKADEAIVEANKETAAKELVDKLVNANKVKKEDTEKYVKLAMVDYDGIKNIFELVTVKKVAQVVNVAKFDGKNGTEDRTSWSFRDWDKKDGKGLLKMKNETPELYSELFETHYGSKPANL